MFVRQLFEMLEKIDDYLVAGLVAGLVWGLAGGLLVGLAWGLAGGLLVGLAGGLASGLVNLSEYNIPIWIIFTTAFVLMEIIYLVEARSRKKDYTLFESLWKKVPAYFDALLIVFAGLNIKWIATKVKWLPEYSDMAVRWLGYIGIALIVCVGIYAVLWLNWKLGNSLPKNKKR